MKTNLIDPIEVETYRKPDWFAVGVAITAGFFVWGFFLAIGEFIQVGDTTLTSELIERIGSLIFYVRQ